MIDKSDPMFDSRILGYRGPAYAYDKKTLKPFPVDYSREAFLVRTPEGDIWMSPGEFKSYAQKHPDPGKHDK